MNPSSSNSHPDNHAEGGQPAPNPYQGRVAPDRPDLDAGAPYLNPADVQRLNRKALVFLAGIVVLLAAIAIWIFAGGLSGPAEPPPRAQPSEQLVIPAAPRDLPELPPERPVAAPPELPPLPVVTEHAAAPAMMPGMGQAPGMDFLDDRPRQTLRDRRIADASAGGLVSAAAAGAESMDAMGMGGQYPGMGTMPPEPTVKEVPPDGVTSARPLYSQDTLLLRGTYIRCVLQSRVITDFPGYTSCIVTEPVYSVNGRRLLLPRGSKVSGSYNANSIIGDRAAIVWDRITTPTGLDVNMRSPGVDALGSAGNAGHYTAHWGQRISSALLISVLADAFKYAGAKHGPSELAYAQGVVVQSPYESTTARTLERMANMAMERNMSRPPTVTINQGTVVNVYVARDVDFSAVLR